MQDDATVYRPINANQSVTNTLHGSAFYASVIQTCEQIYEILADHCGPHASDAMIIQNNEATSLKDRFYTIFTRDGINIVKSIHFISPIQTHVQDLVAYIGSRVESLSHDGTTTAMMFFTGITAAFFKRFKSSVEKGKLPDYRLIKELKEILIDLSLILESQFVVTVEKYAELCDITEREAIRRIAHSQAMLSSKCDTELAEAVGEFVETLPKEFYRLFTISQSGIETEKRFTVIRDTFDFELAVMANIDDMNYNMNMEYFSESCDLLVCEDDLIHGNPALSILEVHLHAAESGLLEQDLVIIAKTIDSRLTERIKRINQAWPQKVIAFPMSLYNQWSSKVTALSAVMAMASVYPLHEVVIDPSLPYLIRNVCVHYKTNKRVTLSNLYPKDGSTYHPSFTDPDRFAPYTVMVKDLRSYIESVTSGRDRIQTAADDNKFKECVQIYRRMISADVRNLQLSGMRHETLADHDILRDSLGAVLSSLEKGFVLDGYLKLYVSLANKNTVFDSTWTMSVVRDVIHDILRRVHKLDAKTYPIDDTEGLIKNPYLSNDTTVFHLDNQNGTAQSDYEGLFETLFDARLSLAKDLFGWEQDVWLNYPVDQDPVRSMDMRTPVIQPADTYREMFVRFGDLLPKLLNTSRAIIPGTTNTGE